MSSAMAVVMMRTRNLLRPSRLTLARDALPKASPLKSTRYPVRRAARDTAKIRLAGRPWPAGTGPITMRP